MTEDGILIIEDMEDLFDETEEEVLSLEEELPVSDTVRETVPLIREEESAPEKAPKRPEVRTDRTPVPVRRAEEPEKAAETPSGKKEAEAAEQSRKKRVPRKRGRKKFPWKKAAAITATAAFLGALGAYGYGVYFYSSHFLPGTVAEGVNIEDLTADEAAWKLTASKIPEDQSFTLTTKEESRVTFDTSPLRIRRNYEGIGEALSAQEKWKFLFTMDDPKELSFPYDITFDEESLPEVVAALPVCDPENTEVHEDSFVYRDRDGKYKVKEAFDGNEIDQEILSGAIRKAVIAKETELNIADTGAYITCDVREDDGTLQKTALIENSYEAANVRIDLGKDFFVRVTPDELRKMTAEGAEAYGKTVINEDELTKYVEKIARIYSTKSGSGVRYFKSITGKKPVVHTDYGWEMDVEKTKEALIPVITDAIDKCLSGSVKGAGTERTAAASWLQEGISHGERDTGDTWVEVDLTNQKMYFIENGALLIESDCVTGKDTADRRTPPGIFTIRFKSLDRYLVGYNPDGSESYRSHVNYWMPFNKNIGLHDATWRGSFGGTIYQYNGSHGCVNLPLKVAKELYQHVYKDMAVIVYK